MKYKRMPIEIESPEEMGYSNIKYNLAESSVRDLKLSDLKLNTNDLLLCYGEHKGDTTLREQIILGQNDLNIDNVLTTTGAAMALFAITTTLLRPKDHLIVIRPNYATNLETPRAIGCKISFVDLSFENNFDLDINKIKSEIKPTTKLISLTTPHNPTGKVYPKEIILELAQFAAEKNIYLLVDETYRDLMINKPAAPPQYFAAYADNIISVCSLSKAFGVPGIRVGWIICRDKTLMYNALAAKEQICIGGSVLDEAVAVQVLMQREIILNQLLTRARENWAITEKHFAKMSYLQYLKPDAGVVCFPQIAPSVKFDFNNFKTSLFEEYKTVVGFGHWFEQPNNYFRIGFGYPLADEMTEGLSRFQNCLEKFIY